MAGIEAQPKSSALPYSAGLAWLRVGDSAKANQYLKQAAETAEHNPQYWYVYGLALENSDVLAASKALNTAYKVGGNPQHLFAECEVLARNYKDGSVAFAFEQCLKQLGEFATADVIQRLRASINQ